MVTMKLWSFLICGIILGPITLRAQNQANDFAWFRSGDQTFGGNPMYWYWLTADTVLANKHVKAVTECHTYNKRNGRKQSKPTCTFKELDTAGHVIYTYQRKSSRKITNTMRVTYDENARATRLEFGTHRRKSDAMAYTYNDSGLLTRYVRSHGNQIKSMRVNEYRDQKYVDKSYTYFDDTTQYKYLTQSWYENDTGRLIRRELLTAKGKRKYLWDYSCNIQGDISKAEKKAEARVCRSEVTLPNGHTQYVYEELTKDGLMRYIYEYDSLKRQVYYAYYSGSNGENPTTSSRTVFSDTGLIRSTVSFYAKSAKRQAEYIYHQNEKGQNTYMLAKYYTRKEKPKQTVAMAYTYQNDLLVLTRWTNLKKPGNTSVTSYQYSFLEANDQ